jgi:hypothetical protein
VEVEVQQQDRAGQTLRPVVLTGRLAEFRTALEDEIAAAGRSAFSGGILLTDGRRIGRVGSQFQYAFPLESLLDAPEGAPGDLRVAERAPLQVILLSVEGLRVTLSVPMDLGGFVAHAKLVTDLTYLLRRLIERRAAPCPTLRGIAS